VQILIKDFDSLDHNFQIDISLLGMRNKLLGVGELKCAAIIKWQEYGWLKISFGTKVLNMGSEQCFYLSHDIRDV